MATEWSPPRTTGTAPPSRASPTRSRRSVTTSTISARYFKRGSPAAWVSGIFTGRSPQSSTSHPRSRIRSSTPATRKADGPMSTPRRPAPRSSGTPMRVTCREFMREGTLARDRGAHNARSPPNLPGTSVDGPMAASDNPLERFMPRPAARKAASAVSLSEAPDLLAILVKQGMLNEEQAERVARARKVNAFSVEQAVVQLGPGQRRPGRPGPRRGDRPALRQDQPPRPRPRRGHQGGRRSLRPPSRHGRHRQDRRPPHRRGAQSVCGVPVRGHQAGDRPRRRPGGGHPQRRGDHQQGLLRPEVQPEARREAARPRAASPPSTSPTRSSSPRPTPTSTRRRRRWSRPSTRSSLNAFEQRASDIHFEPKREITLVRLRIDGVLHDVHVHPADRVRRGGVPHQAPLRRQPRGEAATPGRPHQARAGWARGRAARLAPCPRPSVRRRCCGSSTPTSCSRATRPAGVLARTTCRSSTTSSAAPTGIILVTGPTGSGKTTTLYSVLKHLSRPEVNIVTIEDPVEMVFEDFNQVAGRAADRRRPSRAPCAPCCGRTPTSSWSARSATRRPRTTRSRRRSPATWCCPRCTPTTPPSSITRLLDLGVPHFLITSTLIGVIAQRLMRENCPHCTEEYAPTEEEALAMAHPLRQAPALPVPPGERAACIAARRATRAAPGSTRSSR